MTEQDDLLPKKPGHAIRSSNGANGGWKKRQIETLTCPSGQVVRIRRPGPEFTLRAGKVARTFSHVLNRQADNDEEGLSEHERGLKIIANMTESELANVMVFARELVCSMLVSPRLVQSPRGEDEIGPDDIGDDFWWLFSHAMGDFFGFTVPVGDEEVKVADLETFRTESSVPGDSADGAEVRTDTEQPVGDSGLVGSS